MMHIPEAIQAERTRQVQVEGWSYQHDDEHADGSMLNAARIYWWHATRPEALPMARLNVRLGGRYTSPLMGSGRFYQTQMREVVSVPRDWPWDARWWKPKTPRRDLERAGALCLAEIDRQKRVDSQAVNLEANNLLRRIIAALEALPDEPSAPTQH